MNDRHANKRIEDLLRANKLRVTPSRRRIIDLLLRAARPLSADEVHAKARREMDRTTVYRTLELFERLGITRRVDLRQGHQCFELADDHHHHVTCTSCGIVRAFRICEYEYVAQQALAQVPGFSSIDRHSLELFGRCNACAG